MQIFGKTFKVNNKIWQNIYVLHGKGLNLLMHLTYAQVAHNYVNAAS